MGHVDALSRTNTGASSEALRIGVSRLAETCVRGGGLPLRIVLPDQSRFDLGVSPRVTLRVTDPALLTDLAAPSLGALGDAFIDGRLEIDGDLLEALPLGERLVEAGGSSVAQRMLQAWRRHRRGDDRSAIGYHYDVGDDFYRLWLDERMVYSCAYFRTGAESIDDAQIAKLDHVCRKLRLAPGEQFLDIGCGWGGLAMHAVQHYGVRAVGITLSKNQAQHAAQRVRRAGLQDRIEIHLLDYRDLPRRFAGGTFDKVASIGMFEHVGVHNLPDYFDTIAAMLRDRGLFLNHGITSADVDSRPVGSGVSEFINRHVFPRGELPHLHVAVQSMSAAGFEIADIESLRPHYARTLAEWYRRLERRSVEAASLVAPRTLRTWRIYLAGCSYGFERGWINIYQLLGSRQRTPGPTQLPLTREWIYAKNS
jgi:cyclopropane-fatty-acyl-phospholipid synthase